MAEAENPGSEQEVSAAQEDAPESCTAAEEGTTDPAQNGDTAETTEVAPPLLTRAQGAFCLETQCWE